MNSISFEGNIGAGKSTILKIVQEEFDVEILEEPVNLWQNIDGHNLLEHFYSDPKKYAYSFQSFAFVSRIMNQIEPQVKPLRVMERSSLSDRCFALNCHEIGLMTDMEIVLYEKWWNFFINKFNGNPTKIIYLRTDPEVCMERIKKRNRSEEKDLDIEYLKKLHTKHEEWFPDQTGFENILGVQYMALDADVDFLNDPDILRETLESIRTFIES